MLSDNYRTQIRHIKDLIEDNHKEQFLSTYYSEIFATAALSTTIVNLFLLFKVFKDHRKLKTLTAALSMVKSAHCLSADGPFPSTPDPSSPKQEVICYDPVVSGLFTFLSTLSIAIILYQQWKGRNLCCGYLYSNIIQIKLILGEATYYIPLKLRKITGIPQRVTINALPHPSQVRLVKNWIWDTLAIDWLDVEVTNEGEPIGLPRSIVIPLKAKYRVRCIMHSDFHVNLALCHGQTWYDLTANSRAPIHHPVHRVGNPGDTSTAPFVLVHSSEGPTAFSTPISQNPPQHHHQTPAAPSAPLQPRTLDFKAIEEDAETSF